jgi:plastocyanin
MAQSLSRAARAVSAALALAPGSAPAAGPAAAKVYTVTIRDMAFGPLPKTLKVGDAIEWVNADLFRHSATARDNSFDVELNPRGRARTALKKAGQISFYCRFHPGMTGRLSVAK